MLTLADVIEALSGQRIPSAGSVITDAVIDSRQAIPGALFIALPGTRLDGHDFVGDAFQRGAQFAFIQHELEGDHVVLDLRQPIDLDVLAPQISQFSIDEPICLLVEDALSALQHVAHYWRRKLNLRVIGITGSVGKSTTKEQIAHLLERRYRTLKSPGNLNNEIGLPLTILRLSESHQRAVLEMGFYVPGEIAFLCDIALPQVGVVTNIGTVHAERAGSQQAIFEGKSELVQALPSDGVAILNYDDPWVYRMKDLTPARVMFYGLDSSADLWADEVEGLGLEGIRLRLHYQNEVVHLRIPLIGRHSVHTVLRAAAVGLVDGLTWQEIVSGLHSEQTQLRLVAVRTKKGALILDDTYNASPESTLAALNLLGELEGRKIAVLGDMLELGQYEQHGHNLVGGRAAEVADILITVGQLGLLIAQAALKAGMPGDCVIPLQDNDQVVACLSDLLVANDVVLIKGSHGMHMERITAAIEDSE